MSWRPIALDDTDEVCSRVAVALNITIGEVALTFRPGGQCSGIDLPHQPNDDLGEWQWIEAHGVRRATDGTYEMLERVGAEMVDGYVPAVQASCNDVPAQRARRRRSAKDPAAELEARIAAIKAKLVLAMRHDRADEVATLRTELAEARAAAPTKIEE